ncbi:MAG: YggT family protein [Chloroflexi bacterium]|nr:YggT family protein [Chloroflexota bacterium]MCI0848384.1 YggT family protein [Chloroflexota bacterium]MCI0901279.1 YggT family protein [Chloroflexota bacterium]
MAGLINAVLTIFTIAIFARVILTFIIPMSGNRPHPIVISISTLVNQVTEPVLGPVRRSLPTFGGMDFSPMVVLIVLIVLRRVVDAVL